MADDNQYQSENPYMMVFPSVVEPVETKDDSGANTGKKAYSVDFLMAPGSEDFIPLCKAVVNMVKEHFPAKYATAVKAAGAKPTYRSVLDALIEIGAINVPFALGDAAADKRLNAGKQDGEYQRGMYLFKAGKPELKRDGSKLIPPALGGFENGKIRDYDNAEKRALAADRFYFGAMAYFRVSLAPYTVGKGGVKAYLNMVLVTGEGERKAGGSSVAEAFGKHQGKVTNYNPVGEDELA